MDEMLGPAASFETLFDSFMKCGNSKHLGGRYVMLFGDQKRRSGKARVDLSLALKAKHSAIHKRSI